MRVLIVRLGALGDIIHAAPVAAAIRAAYPDARLDWVVDAKHRGVLDLLQGIDNVIAWRGPRLIGDGGLLPVVRSLRAARYEVALDLQGLLKSAMLGRLSGAARVVGFAPSSLREPAARWLYTETVAPRDDGHVVDKNVSLLNALGIEPDARPVIFKAAARLAVGEFVETLTSGDQRAFAVVNPGAGWPNKQWPAERYGALASWLAIDLGLAVCVTWGPGEQGLAQQVVEASRGRSVTAPATKLPDLLALLRRASLVVTGDTGPMHLAAAAGVKVVGVFGPTSPVRNGPFGMPAGTQVSRYDVCECHYARRCLTSSRCIDDIALQEVKDAVSRALGEGTRRG